MISACSDTGQVALENWISEQKSQIKPKVAPISEPKKFSPQAYSQDGSIEPFSPQKLTQALRQEATKATANAALIAPELNRRKEPLENHPLDSMRMVGSLNKAGQLVALIRIDNLLYQVKTGSYLGQNYGKVTKITETELVLREIVQDAAGEWIERSASLQLQERSK
jgi:type IV pilus assembly protein PilP